MSVITRTGYPDARQIVKANGGTRTLGPSQDITTNVSKQVNIIICTKRDISGLYVLFFLLDTILCLFRKEMQANKGHELKIWHWLSKNGCYVDQILQKIRRSRLNTSSWER